MTTIATSIIPWSAWRELYPDPTLADLRWRYELLAEAVRHRRESGRKPNRDWLAELLGTMATEALQTCAGARREAR